MIKKLLILIVLLFLASPCWSATYYVCDTEADCDAGSAGNTDWETGVDTTAGAQGESRGAPYLTIEYAMSTASDVSAGDTIIVGAGRYCDHDGDGYTVQLGISGTSNNRITVRSESPWEAEIDGTCPNSDDWNAIRWNDQDYVTFEDFDITGGSNAIIVSGHYNTLRNNKIHDQKDSHFWSSCLFVSGASSNLTVDGNEFYNCGTGPNGYDSDCPTQCGKILGYAIYLRGTSQIIENNIFRDPNDFSLGFIKADGHQTSVTGPSPELTIRNNVFSGHSWISEQPRTAPWDSWNSHNFFSIFSALHPTNDEWNDDVIVANNVFTDLPASGEDACSPVAIKTASGIGNNEYQLYSNRSEGEIYCDGDGHTAFESDTQDEDQGWTVANFGFTDAANDDYTLTGSSLLIDAGNATYASVADHTGANRDASPDIGAYERLNPPLQEDQDVRFRPGAGSARYDDEGAAIQYIAP